MSVQRKETVLDARGLKCPLPVLKARRVLKDMAPGGLLRVLATDPGADKDFAHFCNTTGCVLVEKGRLGEELHFVLRKPG
jgi:tRNA 2-thiouridine synthesizing protein A